jgi:hypothetical protein
MDDGACGATATEVEAISRLLNEVAQTHHQVYRIVDGIDGDWASWYADWLARLSELPSLVDGPVVRSRLTGALVSLDEEFTAARPSQQWEDWYAERLVDRLEPGPAGKR